MIQVENLSKSFTLHNQGGTVIPVMAGAALHVDPGECVGLVSWRSPGCRGTANPLASRMQAGEKGHGPPVSPGSRRLSAPFAHMRKSGLAGTAAGETSSAPAAP